MNNRIVRQRVPATTTASPAAGQRPNSVNLSGPELERLLVELDGPPGAGGEAAKKRGFVRLQFRPMGVMMRVEQSGGGGVGSSATVTVACRNLSRGGMSVLHGSFIHPGSGVTMFLKTREQTTAPVAGTIVRCRHVRGMVHELGVRFKDPIETKEFVARDPFSDSFSLEKVEPAELVGCVVAIDDSAMDLKLVQHYLRETQVRVRTATSRAQAAPLIAEGCDLVLCDYDLGDATLVDVVQDMRSAGINTPVIAMTADTSTHTRQKLLDVEAGALIAKPISQSLLLRAMAEFLVVSSGNQAMKSTLEESDPNSVLVESFVQQARQFGKRLGECIEREDAAGVRSICLQVRGTAPMLGFAALGKLADAAINAVIANTTVAGAVVPLRSLIAACQRIQA